MVHKIIQMTIFTCSLLQGSFGSSSYFYLSASLNFKFDRLLVHQIIKLDRSNQLIVLELIRFHYLICLFGQTKIFHIKVHVDWTLVTI